MTERPLLWILILEWQKASGMQRRDIFKAAAREAKLFAPQMDKELLKQRKLTARRVIEEERKADILQKIRDEIEDETGRKAGQKEVLKRYQPMMTAVMKTLDNDELEQAQAKADEWTNQAPDATVQAKTAKKKGEKMVKHFAKEMFTQAGMRVFVLGTWKDEKGGLLTSGFDFNEQLGRGISFMKEKDWQVILPAWEDYIGEAFDVDQDQDGTVIGGMRRVPKPQYEFDEDRKGLPILPDMDDLSLETKKGMIRSFLTTYYRKCCGKPKVPVPWSDILKGQSRFISSTYLLDGVQIMEPSKLIRRDADSLLEHWYDQQENQVGPTFQFKGWIDDKGKIRLPVGESSEYSDGDADNESVLTRPTKKSSAAAVHASAGLATHRPRSAKTSYVTSDNDRDDEGPGTTNADISPLQGQATGNRTDLAHEGLTDCTQEGHC
ncbi:hypothetical protein DEU56DRAFT_912099 [Suillus clintonianus]|uniref:uncharacterized protein n=1 Tax=Suillus clintonianus TaxID=1904413 RepID=UPI001B869B3B|nr:uncharacterized protein DEU56DRAFT_912099 [Suillus clintonianus]KAG2139259.1 hypothetical protein DEU56DRAFT_912099 [Suillus clintonianus]